MKILQVHNLYRKRGGEDTVVEEEKNILEQNGHTVIQYVRNNTELEKCSKFDLLKAISSLRGSSAVEKTIEHVILKEQPDICHVHNVFSLITPVVYQVCKQNSVPVVQTLHNFRLLCTNSMFFRNGHICEECIGRSPFHSLRYKCYRDSYLQTAVMADALQHHRRKSTWSEAIDTYVCLSDFAKQKFVEGGLPEQKLYVKPNFVMQPKGRSTYQDFFLFVGRLEVAKGLLDLIAVAKMAQESKFVVIGSCDDPSIFSNVSNIEYLGERSRVEVLEYLSSCIALVFPSVWYEGMPMVILEAFAMQKPVIARNIGAMSTMIQHEGNGLKYSSIAEFTEMVNRLEQDPALTRKLGEEAFQEYKKKYTPEQGYKQLMKLYHSVLENKNA